jgi:hypothetical protein
MSITPEKWHVWMLDTSSPAWQYEGQLSEADILEKVRVHLPVRMGSPPGSLPSYTAFYTMPA